MRGVAIDGITTARVVPTEAGPALLAVSRYNREEGRLTGGVLVPIALSGSAPIALAPIPLDEIDARDPAIIKARMVRAELSWPSPGRTVVHLIGDRRETVLADGRELSRAPIDETRVLPGR
ncbi:MAG: hypothetical protein U0359_17935 [Byssovorax sp.]